MAPPSTTANFSTNAVSSAASANPYHSRRPAAAPQAPVPILQPQPIRPIPPIPLSDLAAASEEERDRDHTSPRAGVPDHHHHQNSHNNRLMKSEKSPGLSPLSLLCQPVSDAVRYQLKTMGDLAGNTSSEEDDEEDDDEDEEVNDAEATLGAYVGIVSDDMILPSSQTTAYFDTRLTRPNKVKQFQCDCGCMGVCLG
ncbi:hypothetical protein SERLA73DRAFT_174330 [Serpula lacrymans var. lacrymans S7.3]|uniref:Uncharacterized protein n=1 Tax=Serpula lacrymans var. lacrymans (strain S7.3) TaxID=936435 RepID=F8PF72_SERL3|nr:hypothetical protein SERLA73DRAFT_174330 [Serpula lacrymans var. lacrymans S7.3]